MHVNFGQDVHVNAECIEFLLIMFDILEHILWQYKRVLNIQTARYTQLIYSDYVEFTQESIQDHTTVYMRCPLNFSATRGYLTTISVSLLYLMSQVDSLTVNYITVDTQLIQLYEYYSTTQKIYMT